MTSNPGDLARPTMSRRVLASATRYSVTCDAGAAGDAGRPVGTVAFHEHAVEDLVEGLVSRDGTDDADVVAVRQQGAVLRR